MHVVYLHMLITLALWSPRRFVPPSEPPDVDLPHVSVLIAAHNEATIIRARVENFWRSTIRGKSSTWSSRRMPAAMRL